MDPIEAVQEDPIMSRQTDTAFRKGMTARRDGAGRLENPYRDLRTDRGGVTFSRAFRKRWFEGGTCRTNC